MLTLSASLSRFVAALIVAGSLAACTTAIDTHGNLPSASALDKIEVGKLHREDVQEILGSPSSVAAFDDETWYYIGTKTETFAFFDPDVLERKVVAITFDKSGVVKAISTLGLKDGKQVALVNRKTPTAGNDFTILQQIFGNIGKFNSDKDAK